MMKKQWMKACALALAMSLLTMGGAGCSDGSFLGIQIGDNETPTPIPDGTGVVFSIPEPFRTVEEIKASGDEITDEEILNAFDCLAYNIAIGYMEEEEGAQFITSNFINITTQTYNAGTTMEDIKEHKMPFYTAFEDGRYPVDVNLELAAFGTPLKVCPRVNLPNGFGRVLDILGLSIGLVDDKLLSSQIAIELFAQKGNPAFDDIDLTLEEIAERVAQIENEEDREYIINFFEQVFNNFDDLRRPFIPDTSQSYTE